MCYENPGAQVRLSRMAFRGRRRRGKRSHARSRVLAAMRQPDEPLEREAPAVPEPPDIRPFTLGQRVASRVAREQRKRDRREREEWARTYFADRRHPSRVKADFGFAVV